MIIGADEARLFCPDMDILRRTEVTQPYMLHVSGMSGVWSVKASLLQKFFF